MNNEVADEKSSDVEKLQLHKNVSIFDSLIDRDIEMYITVAPAAQSELLRARVQAAAHPPRGADKSR
jgi:hypothetical protein